MVVVYVLLPEKRGLPQ